MAKHPAVRRVLGVSMLAGVAYAIWRAIEANRTPDDGMRWESQPFPFPPQPRASPPDHGSASTSSSTVSATATSDGWADPVDGACPSGYPVKGKLSSGIYHVPGGTSYERTTPDRCYVDAAAAESNGLRASKR
jgi:hypothetical protein